MQHLSQQNIKSLMNKSIQQIKNQKIVKIFFLQVFRFKISYFHSITQILRQKSMWKTVNSVYKSANKNIKKLGQNIPNIKQKVSSGIQNINIKQILTMPKIVSSKQTQLEKAINPIFKNKKPVMPINKMSAVAQLSYQSDSFQQISDMIFQKLRVFRFQSKYAKQTLNSLVLLSYLLKNGASGFIDQFREEINIFQQHSLLSLQNSYVTDDKELSKLKTLIFEIKQRSRYIMALLTDKKRLMKEKQISMQIKKKIIQKQGKLTLNKKYNSKDSFNESSMLENGQADKNEKLQSFLQHYVWKYWNKFDQKMQSLTDKIIDKIDQYLDMQQPQAFQIDQIQNQEPNYEVKTEGNIQQKTKIKQLKFLKQRNQLDLIDEKQQDGPILNTQLI